MLSKHAGLWITLNNEIMYSQATHINFICPMRFDAFPLDTQVGQNTAAADFNTFGFFSDLQVSSRFIFL